MKASEGRRARELRGTSRREFLKTAAAGIGAVAGVPGAAGAFDLEAFFQKHFRELDRDDIRDVLLRLERKYSEKYGKPVEIDAVGPVDEVLYGYGLDISRCIGCRRCVYACVDENNQSRDPQIHWIRVLEFERESLERSIDLEEGDPYYDRDRVPAPGKLYLPIACQQCEDSPCTDVCPTGATWREPDGIVAIDYDWCIGCRYCMASCPYGARHFNWAEPKLPSEEFNPKLHLLGNRPRPRGVVEKCTFCIQRTRKGLYPACVEICPVGARKFGNLLDPESEIRYLMKYKRTFVLKAELETRPKFFYFYGSGVRRDDASGEPE
jgi:molybdopterin-containing oxidoreductase family iron-sulfur binding subunit